MAFAVKVAKSNNSLFQPKTAVQAIEIVYREETENRPFPLLNLYVVGLLLILASFRSHEIASGSWISLTVEFGVNVASPGLRAPEIPFSSLILDVGVVNTTVKTICMHVARGGWIRGACDWVEIYEVDE